MRKAIKYILVSLVVLLVLYNSVYFKKLDEVKAASASKEFNAPVYAQNFWSNKLMPGLSKASEINHLVSLLKADPENTFTTYSHALGIGNITYFLVSGKGEVTAINESSVSVMIKGDSSQQVIQIATDYIFGNAVRDASGAVNINEFTNTMDFNNVSAEINKIIRTEVLPPFKQLVKKGSIVEFTGAIELNKEHVKLDNIEVIPVSLKITQ